MRALDENTAAGARSTAEMIGPAPAKHSPQMRHSGDPAATIARCMPRTAPTCAVRTACWAARREHESTSRVTARIVRC
jgi:hypothetical protein